MKKNSVFINSLFRFCWLGMIFIFNSLICTSCKNSFLDVQNKLEKVCVKLPSWPSDLPELCFWRVELGFCGECNVPKIKAEQELVKSSNKISFCIFPDSDSFNQKFFLNVEKNFPVCIKVFPVTVVSDNQNTSFFKPAGNIYPYSYDDGNIVLDWTSGYGAAVMDSMIFASKKSGYSDSYIRDFLSKFNWEKLLEILNQKSESAIDNFFTEETFNSAVCYNPWLLDYEQVLEQIAYENFSAAKLNLSGVYSSEFDISLVSSFVPENEIIKEFNRVTIKKDYVNLFSFLQSYAVIITGSSEKNMSLEFISMPIFK